MHCLAGNFDETDESFNNFLAIEANTYPCNNILNGFNYFKDASIEGGRVVRLGEKFHVNIRLSDCFSSPNFQYSGHSTLQLSGSIFQVERDDTPSWVTTARYHFDEQHLSPSVFFYEEQRSGKGLLIKRANKCWPSSNVSMDVCVRSYNVISFTMTKNGIFCNRYWKLMLRITSAYGDTATYHSDFLIDNVLVTCPQDTLALFNPTLLSSSTKFVPEQNAFSSFKLTVAESWTEQLNQSGYSVFAHYGACSNVFNEANSQIAVCKAVEQSKL